MEIAVNDSATRVSAIWISFLIFALYLLIAATTVTQRQLLLAEPIELPVLNIDLPLWGFFFLAPILFVIFHLYTLLQVLLLGRTTAAYNAAVERLQLSPDENVSLRQRLANTVFAQIFAGSPREREGFIGWLLRAIVWITLAIAPIVVVLAFQFSFLAYHSHIATWTHRFLILVELFAFFLIWPLALDAEKNFEWPRDMRHEARSWVRENAIPLLACILYLLIPLSLATFPGEPHLNLFTGEALTSVQCKRWWFEDLKFDRLTLPHADIVDHVKLERIEKATVGERAFQGERTHILNNRDLNCSDLSNIDLRRVALNESSLIGANLVFAQLEGADLHYVQLQGADLTFAQLQGADLHYAQLQGADLTGARLQGAHLSEAQLQGAQLSVARLQGAQLGAAQLQGADLTGAWLQGTDLASAGLQGADLRTAQLQGANLSFARLQGADLGDADLGHSDLADVSIWRARNANCANARIADPLTNNVIESDGGKPFRATPDAIAEFIEASIAEIPDAGIKAMVADRMRRGLVIDPAKDDTETIAKVWITCEGAETSTMPQEKFDEQRAAALRDLVCHESENRKAIAAGIIDNWVSTDRPSVLSVQLARGLLGQDGNECAATTDFDNATVSKLKDAAAAKVIPAATSAK